MMKELMKIVLSVLVISGLVLNVGLAFAATKKPGERPNIIFILADDLGYMDLAVNGSQYYETPNIDRLAARGMRFTNAYAANPLCTPTRASILTGRYPTRYHVTTPAGHLPPNPEVELMPEVGAAWQKVVTPQSRTFLPLEEVTIAEQLKDVGYKTGFIGKWHLGHIPYSPESQGFDYNVAGGPHSGPPNYFSPYRIKNLPDGPQHEYITDRITDEAISFLEANRDTSFFLCLWHFAVHAPFQGKLKDVDYFSGKKDPRGKQGNAIMAAMIKNLDENIGRLMDEVDRLGLNENTMIVFFSDNGGNEYDVMDGDQLPTNNDPLRYGKGNIYEGGIRVPLIVVWDNNVEQGVVNRSLVNSVDFFPTLCEIAGTDTRGVNVDGLDISAAFLRNKEFNKREIYCHFPHYVVATDNYPATSVRSKDWKLIKVYGEGSEQGEEYRLYNLATDASELTNLAARYPKKVKELGRLIDRHEKEIGAYVPFRNPAFDPTAKSPMGTKSAYDVSKYPMY